jgi:hypothetical protein
VYTFQHALAGTLVFFSLILPTFARLLLLLLLKT